MDTDAYGGFVALDVELTTPLFRLGLLGGTQYADIADDLRPPARRFRHSLESLKRAVEYFKARGVSVVAHLGDVLAPGNAQAGSASAAMQSFDAIRSRLPNVPWHVAAGACEALEISTGTSPHHGLKPWVVIPKS